MFLLFRGKRVGGSVDPYTPGITTLTMNRNACNDEKDHKLGSGYWGTLLHEVFHVFGITHTQRREDRGKFVTVFWDNIKPEAQAQYEICPQSICKLYPDVPYECNSIMHYKERAFSVDGVKRTMISKNPASCYPKYLIDEMNIPTKNDWKLLRKVLGCN